MVGNPTIIGVKTPSGQKSGAFFFVSCRLTSTKRQPIHLERGYFVDKTPKYRVNQLSYFVHVICFNKHENRMLWITSTTGNEIDSQFLASFRPI